MSGGHPIQPPGLAPLVSLMSPQGWPFHSLPGYPVLSPSKVFFSLYVYPSHNLWLLPLVIIWQYQDFGWFVCINTLQIVVDYY